MEGLKELEIGTSVESFQRFLDLQRDLFHSQIDQLEKVVVTQCKLTGVNPLSQEMAAGALSIKIGKRPRDLLNPKAVKYMQSVFAIKDAISKKESREISVLFGVTVTQVREFFTSQRSRVRRLVRLSHEKSIRSNAACNELNDGVATTSDPTTSIDPVPLNSVGPITVEDGPSCSTQDNDLPGIDDLDKKFVQEIFSLMRKEETFSGQVNLMEWILKIQNSSVLCWFLTKGGVMILATWLSQATVEEQTSVLHVILKVLCHLPLHKAVPVHMSVILQSVNKLRFYRTSDISNRAKILLSRWSKLLARIQALKKPNGIRSLGNSQMEIVLNQSVGEFMYDQQWESSIDIHEDILTLSQGSSDNFRKSEPQQPVKLLTASSDDSNRKNILGVSSSQIRKRRKVQLVEQPGQTTASRSPQASKSASVSQGRPLSADDIQKAKMRAQFLQSKYGKTAISNGSTATKTEGLSRPLTSVSINFSSKSRVPLHPKIEELKIPVTLPSKTTNEEASVDPKTRVEFKALIGENCKKVQISWKTPPEIALNVLWRVGTGENSKEVEVQRNRNRREKETIYQKNLDIPSNPKEPWDIEMDYDDTLTPEILTEQLPDAETQVSHNEHVNNAAPSAASTSSEDVGNGSTAEPDLELLAVLLKNPELVFALTSGQAGNLSNEETVKLLDMIKGGGAGLMDNLSGLGQKVEEKIEVSLPSPTPPTSAGTSGWKPEAVKNPFSQQSLMANRVAHASRRVDNSSIVLPNIPAHDITQQQQPMAMAPLSHHLAAPISQLSLPQTTANVVERQPIPLARSLHQSPYANSPSIETSASRTFSSMKNLPINNASLTNQLAAAAPTVWVEGASNIKSTLTTPSTLKRSPISYQMSRLQMQPQSSLQPIHSEPVYSTPVYSRTPAGNSDPVLDSWRGRQSVLTNPHSQGNQNNYNPIGGGSVQQHHMQPGQWERNEYYTNEDAFESWSPDNSPIRNHEHGRNLPEHRVHPGQTYYRPDQPRQRNSPGFREHNRRGNQWPRRRH